MNIGERIKKIRKKYKLKQAQLAEILGVTTQMIVNYESNTRGISIEKLTQISDYLSFPLYLFFVDDFDEFLNNKDKIPNTDNKIPIISKASAGKGAFAKEEVIDFIEIPKKIFDRCDFATLVQGDSMSPKIEDGEIAFVRKGDFLETGNIGVFYLNEEVFIKKFFLDNLTYTIKLISLNHNYEDIFIKENDDFRIIGRVIGTLNYHL